MMYLGDIGSPTYLVNTDNDEPICVYSIFMWYDSDEEGCDTCRVSVHAKLPFFAEGSNLFMDRRDCGSGVRIFNRNNKKQSGQII